MIAIPPAAPFRLIWEWSNFTFETTPKENLNYLMLFFSRLFAAVTVLVFAECLMSSLNAAIIIGNLPGDDGTSISFASGSTLSIGFSTGSNGVRLESVSLRLLAQNSSGDVSLELRSDQSGTPAAFLESLGTQSVAFRTTFSDDSNYSFTPANLTILQSNTKYWLTISTSIASPNALVVGASATENAPPTALASYFGLRFFDGVSYSNLDGQSVPTFQANGTLSSAAVPEPDAWLFLSTVVGLLLVLRKRPFEALSFKHQL